MRNKQCILTVNRRHVSYPWLLVQQVLGPPALLNSPLSNRDEFCIVQLALTTARRVRCFKLTRWRKTNHSATIPRLNHCYCPFKSWYTRNTFSTRSICCIPTRARYIQLWLGGAIHRVESAITKTEKPSCRYILLSLKLSSVCFVSRLWNSR